MAGKKRKLTGRRGSASTAAAGSLLPVIVNDIKFLNVTSDAPIWTDDMPSERMRSLAIKALERAKDRADRQSRLHDVDAELLPEFMWDFFWDSAVHIIGDKLREISEKSEQKKKGHKTRREGKVDQNWHDGEPFATKAT
ncbi:hypothetical protein THAOC_20429, partial [Thalassiosira oceanica]